MSKARIIGGTLSSVLLLSAPGVAYFEGMIPRTYADPVGIPTICYGHTGEDVTLGRTATTDECRALLNEDLARALDGVGQCINVPMYPHQAAALTSFAFNVGRGALCSSTLARKANQGDWVGACAELSRWTKATYLGAKIELSGLVKRRASERALCEGKP